MARNNTKKIADQVLAKSKKEPEKEETWDDYEGVLIPTGSTLLNLALSGSRWGGFPVGSASNLIGGRSAGKSILALSCFAEMSVDEDFDEYRFIYDDVEEANNFDMEYLFGSGMVDRLEPPGGYDDDENPINSETIQDFMYHFDKAIKDGRPFLYILDSLDALTSDEELEKAQAQFKAKEKGTKTSGSYGMEKAKALKAYFRQTKTRLKRTEGCLLILSQVIDNTDMGFTKHKRAGGNALGHFSVTEAWIKSTGNLKKTHKGNDYIIGTKTNAKVTRTKLKGWVRECDFNIYYDYGIDDIGSMVDWLLKTNTWKKAGQKIKAPELELEGNRDSIIRQIEDEALGGELRELVEETWTEIEESVKLRRKSKYQR